MTVAGKVVVVGGRGLVGAKVSFLLTVDGQEVLPASRRLGVDVITGDGLADALRGARVVVDVTDAPSYDDAALMGAEEPRVGGQRPLEQRRPAAHHPDDDDRRGDPSSRISG